MESLKFKNLEVIKYEVEEKIFYSTQTSNGIFLGSNSLKNLKNLLERKTEFKNAQFEKVFKVIDLKKISVLFHHEQTGKNSNHGFWD